MLYPKKQLGQADDTQIYLAALFSEAVPELKIFLLSARRLITSLESQVYK